MKQNIDSLTIRLLKPQDGAEYHPLRLQALQNNPEAYFFTHESEKDRSEESFARDLAYAKSGGIFGYYGVFLIDNNSGKKKLIGYTQISSPALPKQKHIAHLYNLYIDPKYRGNSIATKLFDHLFKLIKEKTELEQLFITCTKSNLPAQKLYQKLGFTQYATREKTVKWKGEYDDEVEMVKKL